ncbi:MAG: hypothetical protein MK108_02625 [Mariniblastus sp.]|nr:hypothetical protein [Mariniblastus sp.]
MFKIIARVSVLCLVWPLSMVHGDMLIWQDGTSTTRLYGLVEREEPQAVHFRMHPDMGGDLKIIPREEIFALVFHIDAARLMSLEPGNLAAYRDYGEELASQAADLQARDLAIRLFLIVAHEANERPFEPGSRQLRASAIRNLLALARDDEERQAFDQLAVLYQIPDRALSDSTSSSRPEITDLMRANLLDLLVALRTGNREDARRLTKQPGMEQAWKNGAPTCRWDELSRIIEQGEPYAFQLQSLLTMEVELRKGWQVGSTPRTRADSWAVRARDHDPRAELFPRFLDVTEYDPRQNVWCNGQWIRFSKQGK